MDDCKAGREQKFIALDGAICELSRAADGLEGLISEMQNGPIPKVTKVTEGLSKEQPTFQAVYDESSGRIREITDRFRKMTEEIRTRLF